MTRMWNMVYFRHLIALCNNLSLSSESCGSGVFNIYVQRSPHLPNNINILSKSKEYTKYDVQASKHDLNDECEELNQGLLELTELRTFKKYKITVFYKLKLSEDVGFFT